MSLIVDALKKAQRLRLKGIQEVPFLKHPNVKKREGLLDLWKRWILIAAGCGSLLILLFVLWKAITPPLSTQPPQTVVRVTKKPSIPIAEKGPQEPLRDHSSSLQVEKALPEREPSVSEKKEEPLIEQVAEETKIKKIEPKKRPITEKPVSSPEIITSPLPKKSPSVPSKEETSSPAIGVKHEATKAIPAATDLLNYFNLGVHYQNQQERAKAIQAYQKAIELDPTYIEAYNNLGIIYQEMGEFDRALEAYQKSIEINPQYEKGHNNLGILLYLKGRNEEAMEAFQNALAINSNNIESHINLGVLFRKQGQLDKALECYQKALAINPLHGEAHYNIALLYEQSEKVELAIQHYQRFIQLSSRTHPALASKVQAHLTNLMAVKSEKKR